MSIPDRKFIFWITLITILVTTLPYAIGFARQNAEWTFNGFLIGVDDGNTYIAKMLRGANGDWVFRTAYTSEPQQGSLSYFPYILLGKLAQGQGIHDQLLALFQLFRWVGVIIFILGTQAFLTCFIQADRIRRWAMMMILFAGGLGWILPLIGQSTFLGRMPLEFYSPETFGFLSIFTLPHLALGRGLLFWGLAYTIKYFAEQHGSRIFIFASAAYFLSGFFQPIYPAIAIMLTVILAGIHWRTFSGKPYKQFGLFFVKFILAPSLWVIYYLWLSRTDTYFRAWTNQNVITSPNPIHYILAYGLLLGIILSEAKEILGKIKEPKILFLGIWFCLLPLLTYFPSNLQRRLPDGIWTALVILAAVALQLKSKGSARHTWENSIFLISIPATLILLIGSIVNALKTAEPLFIRKEAIQIYQQIYKIDRSAVVVSDFRTSNNLPAYFPLRVITGHGPEATLRPKWEMALSEFIHDDQTLIEMMKELGVRWVINSNENKVAFSPTYLANCHFRLRFTNPFYDAYQLGECE